MKTRKFLIKSAKWLGTFFLAWLLKRILDETGIYESISTSIRKGEINHWIFQLLNYQIPISVYLWKILLFVILIIISYLLIFVISNIVLSNKRKIEKNKRLLKANNIKEIEHIQFKYDIEFDPDNKIFIDNLHPYCLKHGPVPVKMILNRIIDKYICSFPDCDSNIYHSKFDPNSPINRIHNIIISELEENWKRLNNK